MNEAVSSQRAVAPNALLARLARPSAAYKRHAWLAFAGLAVFMVLYLVLAGWFVLTAWKLTFGSASAGKDGFWGWVIGASAALLAIFMLKAIFFVNRGKVGNVLEVTRDEQPRLFSFLDKLADAAGAPRPHRVFLSPQVNAAVFYDLSVLNFILPSRKNLEIGLGLVNALSLGELRAVLAHEFGHFAQKTMAVGRWVYIAQQVAAHLVARRDKLDAFLRGLSRFDLRLAWVGWLLEIVVWSIRSLVDTAFRAVLLLQRALSREMELQADLVAVSLTGSDALIHALHKLQAADDSWDRTLGFAATEHARERPVRDLFALQTRFMERMGQVLNDPLYHAVPTLPEVPQAHRLFKAELAQPPQMWLTHPQNHEREANAKRHYVHAPIDERSAWALFDEPQSLREKVSAGLVQSGEASAAPLEESLAALDESLGRESLDPRYRGVYLGRSVVRGAATSAALVDATVAADAAAFARLYPASLLDDVAQVRQLQREKAMLQALQDGKLQPPGGVIRYRERVVQKSEIGAALDEVEKQLQQRRDRLAAHDRDCRSLHRAAARRLGAAWDARLAGLLALLHYADHTEANLRDLLALLHNVLAVETATKRVGKKGRMRILAVADDLHDALRDVHERRRAFEIDAAVAKRLRAASWDEAVGELGLVAPTDANLGDWLGAIDGWVGKTVRACDRLGSAALDQLLADEATVAESFRSSTPAPAPAPLQVPAVYETLPEGSERPKRKRLTWLGRFQTADGALPMLARLGVAASIVGAVLVLGGSVGDNTLVVYNALATSVDVHVNAARARVGPHSTTRLSLPIERSYAVETRAADGRLVESFSASSPGSFATLVYNVASASPLVQWTASYGSAVRQADRALGSPRWISTDADHVFEQPPSSISTKGGGGTRQVLAGMGDLLPSRQLESFGNDAARDAAVAAHVRWDSTSAPRTVEWMAIAMQTPATQSALAARVASSRGDVLLTRLEEDRTKGAEHAAVCARQQAAADAAPQNGDLQYLAIRCLTDSPARSQAFITAHARFPQNGWLAYAAGYGELQRGRWAEAEADLAQGHRQLPQFAEYIAVDLARVMRQHGTASGAKLAALQASSEQLRMHLALEAGSAAGAGVPTEYAELARGRLADAVQQARSRSLGDGDRVLRLAAASDGADAPLVAAALVLPGERGIDAQTAWASAALAARHQLDPEPFIAAGAHDLLPEDIDRLRRFIDVLKKGGDIGVARRLVGEMAFEAQLHAYTVGLVMLGRAAPAEWRTAAHRLLFATERPYFE